MRKPAAPNMPGVRLIGFRSLLFSLLISGGVLFGLATFMQVTPKVIVHTLRQVSPTMLLCGFLLHLTAYVLRSVRFRLLIHSRELRWRDLFHIVAVHNFMNHVLPMRTGELSYLYLVRKYHGVSLGEGGGTLVVARLQEAICFLLAFALAVLLLSVGGFRFPSTLTGPMLRVAALGSLLAAAAVSVVSLRGKWLLGLLGRVIQRVPVTRRPWLQFVSDKIEEAAGSLDHLASWRTYAASLVLTMGVVTCVYLVGYALLAGMGWRMQLPLVVVCSSLASVAFLLPINSFAGFGTLEAGWTAGCVALGFSKEMGLATGLGVHVIILAYVVTVGIAGLMRLGLKGRAEVRRAGGAADDHPDA